MTTNTNGSAMEAMTSKGSLARVWASNKRRYVRGYVRGYRGKGDLGARMGENGHRYTCGYGAKGNMGAGMGRRARLRW